MTIPGRDKGKGDGKTKGNDKQTTNANSKRNYNHKPSFPRRRESILILSATMH